MSLIRLPSTTMSTGPIGGAPVPSTSVAPRRISRFHGPSPSARGGAAGMLLTSCCAGLAGASSARARADISVRAAREVTGIIASGMAVVCVARRILHAHEREASNPWSADRETAGRGSLGPRPAVGIDVGSIGVGLHLAQPPPSERGHAGSQEKQRPRLGYRAGRIDADVVERDAAGPSRRVRPENRTERTSVRPPRTSGSSARHSSAN